MLKFLKNLFTNPYERAAEELSEEIKRLEPEKIEPDISEPVLSFVNCVKQNHRRFILDYREPVEVEESDEITIVWYSSKTSVFKDRLTGEKWSYCAVYDTKDSLIYGCEFLTEDEKEYILKELVNFYRARWSRLAEIRRIRRQRKSIKERERLKGIYCQ